MDPLAAFLGILLIIGIVVAIAAHLVRQDRSSPRVAATTRLHNATSTGHDPRKKSMFYRTRDGREDYQFSFEQRSDGTWRAYIESQPNYGNRESDAHTTHRLSDGSRKYVCWTDPLQTLAQAKQVAAMWADATQGYIRTGKRF